MPQTEKSSAWMLRPSSRKSFFTDSIAGGDAHVLVIVTGQPPEDEGIPQAQKEYSADTALAISEKLAVPLSAATTR